LAYFVATVVVCLGLTVAAVTHVAQPDKHRIADQPTPPTNSHSQSPVPASSPKAIVGRITGMIECRWGLGTGDEGRDEARGQTNHQSEILNLKSPVRLGDTLALRSGLLEITYDTGAKVILQGPVTYEIESATGGYLAVGKLTAKMENGANSKIQGPKSELATSHQSLATALFAVRTPTAIVTDLGTEFGVEVNERGQTESLVFVGAVTVKSCHSGSKAKPRVVKAGEQAKIDGEYVTVSVTDSTKKLAERFIRKLTNQKHAVAEDVYSKYVLSMNPAVYYRMDWPTDEKDFLNIRDSGPSGCHGAFYRGDEFGQPWLHGRVGNALAFRGNQPGDYAIVPDYPKTSSGRLSASAWVMAESRSDCSAIIEANWLCHVFGQFHLGTSEDGDLAAVVCDSQRHRIMAREGKDKPFPLREWQHVACTTDGARLRLYRNGKEVASVPCLGVQAKPPVSTLTIGFKDDNDTPSKAEPLRGYFWTGRIDELVIFNRTLSAEEVLGLMETAEKSKP
jgi:hypothetical protein